MNVSANGIFDLGLSLRGNVGCRMVMLNNQHTPLSTKIVDLASSSHSFLQNYSQTYQTVGIGVTVK